MPSAPNRIQTALLILTPIRSNRCAQLLRRHSPQGGTPTLRHGACFSTHQHTPTHTRAPSPQHAPHAPCIPLAAHRRNRHTQPARLHPPQGGTPALLHGACFSTHQHTPTRSNPASSIVSTARAPRSMYPASSAQTKPPYTASTAPSAASGYTALLHGACFSTHQHTPAHTNSHQPRLQHRLHSTVSTARAPRPMLPEKPATRARHKLRHRSRDTLQPIRPGRPAARKAGYPSSSQTPAPTAPARHAAPRHPQTQLPYGHKKRSDLSI